MSHSNTGFVISPRVLFCFFLQVRVSVQPFSTAPGFGGVWLHQQAHHSRSGQTDHPHPQQGESHAHHTYFCVVITR